MKIAFFSAQDYERQFFNHENKHHHHQIDYFTTHLTENTVALCQGYQCVCCFVNDRLNDNCLQQLHQLGVQHIALRSAGYNHVDIAEGKKLALQISRVPAYSPYAVAEHAVGLILALNRKIHRAYHRVRENDFSLHGLMGFDLYGKTVGIIGVGKIGAVFATIMKGFGCQLLGYDHQQDASYDHIGIEYVDLPTLYQRADIISLHCPLNPQTHHLINAHAIAQMKPGVMLINTSRGAVIDTQAMIAALKTNHIGYLGLDVYEEEGDLFFEDLSDQVLQDDTFARLQTFPNVIITGHQAFFTKEAVTHIAQTTLSNITAVATNKGTAHLL